jgi:regulator-associated protein of mTOR
MTNHESSKTSTPTIANTSSPTNGNANNLAAGDSSLPATSQQQNLPKSMSSTSLLTKSPLIVSNGNKQQHNLASPILTQSTSMMSGVSTAASAVVPGLNNYTRSNSISSASINNNTSVTMPQQYQSSTKDLFNRVWLLLADMKNDPDPGVAELASKVISCFMNQLNSFDSRKQQFILDQKPSRYLLSPTQQQAATTTAITTEFVPWCCKYFLKPLLSTQQQHKNYQHHQTNSDLLFTSKQVDIYASEFLDQHCKLLYNHKVKRKTPPKWIEPQTMNEILQIKHALKPIHCKFHPYDDQLFVVDKDSNINVYETQMTNKLKLSFSIFQNQSPTSSLNSVKPAPVVTSFNLINVQHEPMFLTGTDDRIVRIFKPDLVNYTSSGTRLVTAFKVFDDKKKQSSNIEVGLIVEWDEPNEILLCSGDTKYIRVWDMNKELYKDYLTQAVSCVSSLTTHQNYTVAGFGDGTIKLFDFRMSNSNVANIQPIQMNSRSTNTQIYQHNSLVLKVKIHKPSMKLITSSTNGDVNLWDLRSLQGCLKTSMNNEQATAVECHPVNELIAVANSNYNQNQSVKVFDFQGRELTCIKHHQGFVGRRISTVTCLDWNSYKNQMVFGSHDNFITMFSCKD